MPRKAQLLTLLVLLIPTAAFAQWVEITPTIGYRFGGDFDDVSFDDVRGDVSLGDSEMFGLTTDMMTRDGWGVELLWFRQSSDLDGATPFINQKYNATLNTFHIGGIYQFRRTTAMQPFVLGTLGTTQIKATGKTQNGFSYAGGGGLKFYFGNHFGARLQGSLLNNHFNGDDEFICDGEACYDLRVRNNVFQFEVTAGFIFKF